MARQILKLKRPPVPFDAATDPERWQNEHRRLLDAARLLWQPIAEGIQGFRDTRRGRTQEQRILFEGKLRYFAPFFLLAGLSVENALKALIIRSAIATGAPPRNGAAALGLFPTQGHSLLDLARCARVSLSSGERKLLERLSVFVTWAGRYPIPKRASQAGFERTTRECDLEDIERFVERVNRL